MYLEDAGLAEDARPVSRKPRDAVQLIADEEKQAKAIMLRLLSQSRRIISNTACLQSPSPNILSILYASGTTAPGQTNLILD